MKGTVSMTKAKEEANKVFILTLKNGNVRKITIPASWKMTFGSLVPYSSDRQGRRDENSGGAALRLYEGSKENLRAVMTDVISIRDASIEMMERRTSVQRKVAQKSTPHGMKDVMVEARMTEWVNPDAEGGGDETPNEFLKLTSPDEEL